MAVSGRGWGRLYSSTKKHRTLATYSRSQRYKSSTIYLDLTWWEATPTTHNDALARSRVGPSELACRDQTPSTGALPSARFQPVPAHRHRHSCAPTLHLLNALQRAKKLEKLPVLQSTTCNTMVGAMHQQRRSCSMTVSGSRLICAIGAHHIRRRKRAATPCTQKAFTHPAFHQHLLRLSTFWLSGERVGSHQNPADRSYWPYSMT